MPDSQSTIIGRLGADPELRFTANGKSVCSFSLAVERRYKQNDEWTGVTTWYNVSLWDAMAENVAASLHKGDRVICVGMAEMREYEAKDGTKGKSLDFRCEAIGADLKWARVEIEKVEREKSYKDGSTTTSRAADPKYGEEEPF